MIFPSEIGQEMSLHPRSSLGMGGGERLESRVPRGGGQWQGR